MSKTVWGTIEKQLGLEDKENWITAEELQQISGLADDMTKQLHSYSGHVEHARKGLQEKTQNQEAAMHELIETRQRQQAYMGQNLGHGNFHPEQYMGAAAAMAHIPPGAFPQGPHGPVYPQNPQTVGNSQEEQKGAAHLGHFSVSFVLLVDGFLGAKYETGGKITLHNDALRWVIRPEESSEAYPEGTTVYRKVAMIYYLTKVDVCVCGCRCLLVKLKERFRKAMASRAAFVAYLCTVQGFCLVSFILQLLGIQVSHGWVAKCLLQLLGTRFGTANGSRQVLDTGSPVVYLSNHRSWGDFWTDAALLGGPSFISRALVAAGIPATAAWGSTSGWLWFFARGSQHKEGAVEWMKNFLSERIKGFPSKGVVVYPEGTRSLLPEGLPLKLGAIASAYQLQWPVQVVITTNKESVTAERDTWILARKMHNGEAVLSAVPLGLLGSMVIGSDFAVHFGTCCVSSVSEAIDPRKFENLNTFLEVVKDTWKKTWQEAYSPNFQMRSEAILPGGKLAKVGFTLQGSWHLQLLRLIFLAFILWLFQKLRAKHRKIHCERDANQEVNAARSE
eukprot:symbB.v1.2.013178.t1/scaffold926.1/size151523/5